MSDELLKQTQTSDKRKTPSFATVAKVALVASLVPFYKFGKEVVDYFSPNKSKTQDPDEYKGSCTATNEAQFSDPEFLSKMRIQDIIIKKTSDDHKHFGKIAKSKEQFAKRENKRPELHNLTNTKLKAKGKNANPKGGASR